MSVKQEQDWITGEEFGRENRRLIDAGVPDEAPEFEALFERVRLRDDAREPRIIKTVRNEGYVLAAVVERVG